MSIRSDRPGPLFVQLEEQSGETFFTILDAAAQWADVDIALSDLKPDPKKKKDGRLAPDQIKQILLADPSGSDGAKGKRSVWIANLGFAGGAPAAASAPVASREAPQGVALGFGAQQDLFECGPGSSAALSADAPRTGAKAMAWSISYRGAEWMWCIKTLDPGRLAGRQTLSLWIKSDREGPVFLQLEEKGGEAFFTQLVPSTEWRQVRIKASEFQLDAKKKKNGRLEMDQIRQILIADPAGGGGASGQRTIQFADWSFE
jgi:hypothetical protein